MPSLLQKQPLFFFSPFPEKQTDRSIHGTQRRAPSAVGTCGKSSLGAADGSRWRERGRVETGLAAPQWPPRERPLAKEGGTAEGGSQKVGCHGGSGLLEIACPPSTCPPTPAPVGAGIFSPKCSKACSAAGQSGTRLSDRANKMFGTG